MKITTHPGRPSFANSRRTSQISSMIIKCHKHAGIHASHTPLRAEHSVGGRLFCRRTFAFVRDGYFLTSLAIVILSDSIWLYGDSRMWEDNTKTDITETTWLCEPNQETQDEVIWTSCDDRAL